MTQTTNAKPQTTNEHTNPLQERASLWLLAKAAELVRHVQLNIAPSALCEKPDF